MPYGAKFEHFYLVRYGWLGVELFFLISGFVILMTLEKCSGFKDFMLRRWLRLFPTMLVCSLLIFVSAPLFSARPAGPAHFLDLLPGLFFIDLGWGWFGAGITPLEGSFWSLFVEVKFYVVFGLAYFVVGRNFAIAILGILFGIDRLAGNAELPVVLAQGLSSLSGLTQRLDAQYFAWFAAGALYRCYTTERRWSIFLLACAVGLLAAVNIHRGPLQDIELSVAGMLVLLLFALATVNGTLQRWLSVPVLLFVGALSYPLYLLHENMMVAMIIMLGAYTPLVPAVLLPVLPVGVVLALSWYVTYFAEPALKNRLLHPYKLFRIKLGIDRPLHG